MNYEFTQDWFTPNIPTWQQVMGSRSLKPKKVLEIGSYEGRATTWIIDNIVGPNGGECYCVDTWEGGIEHDKSQMGAVEQRFDKNVRASLGQFPGSKVAKVKLRSRDALVLLLANGHAGTFDFVYVDGSHQAADVLSDLTLSFALCKIGGLIACDDYMWSFGSDPRLTPKMAIDAFVNCYAGRLEVARAWLYQLYMFKISD